MAVVRWHRLYALGVGLSALACGGNGGGGGTEPPGPPAQLTKSGGDGQVWYFNNALPLPYSVTVRDANNRAVPGVAVDWSITTGGGSFSSDPSTTNSSGVASTIHTLASATAYVVTANVTGVTSVTFTANASAPPTTAAVDATGSNTFNPANVVVQSGGTVTWTQTGGGHNVTFTGGPTPLPANIPDATLATGSADARTRTFTAVGTYNYTCTNHSGMNGTVRVVN